MRVDLRPDAVHDSELDLLAVGLLVGEPPALPGYLTQAFGDGLSALLEQKKFTGKAETSLMVYTMGAIPSPRLLLVGLGEGEPDQLRGAAGVAGRISRDEGARKVGLDFSSVERPDPSPVLEGFQAGSYRFDRYQEESSRKAPCEELLVRGEASPDMVEAAMVVAEAEAVARDLVNEPAEVIHPEALAAYAVSLSSDQVEVTVWDEQTIEAEGMGGLHAVGRGSARPPRFVHMRYAPASEPRARIALVGKGVTFDSGGLSLKPGSSMDTMRCDMAGAATVIGVMKAVAALGLQVEVHGIFGAAENMVSGSSFKLGDILRMYNGKSVEIHNTDAEGRLILADCLAYADKLAPDMCVDLATLTGACVVALGSRYTGLFTRDDALAADLSQAAEDAGEGIWRLPLADHFTKLLKAEWADLNHMGPRWGGASTAAAFLAEFIGDTRWAHLDIAGPAFLDEPQRYLGKGASGAMVRTMVRWLASM